MEERAREVAAREESEREKLERGTLLKIKCEASSSECPRYKLGVAERICVRSRIRLLYGQARKHIETRCGTNIIKMIFMRRVWMCAVWTRAAQNITFDFSRTLEAKTHTQADHSTACPFKFKSTGFVFVIFSTHIIIIITIIFPYIFWVFYGRMRLFRKKRVTWDKIIQWTKFMRHLRLRRKKTKEINFIDFASHICMRRHTSISLFEKRCCVIAHILCPKNDFQHSALITADRVSATRKTT